MLVRQTSSGVVTNLSYKRLGCSGKNSQLHSQTPSRTTLVTEALHVADLPEAVVSNYGFGTVAVRTPATKEISRTLYVTDLINGEWGR